MKIKILLFFIIFIYSVQSYAQQALEPIIIQLESKYASPLFKKSFQNFYISEIIDNRNFKNNIGSILKGKKEVIPAYFENKDFKQYLLKFLKELQKDTINHIPISTC